MNNEMGVIKKFINSFYNFSAYNVFLKQSIGKSVIYLLLLSLVLSIVNVVSTVIQINSGFNEFTTVINNDIPNFEFTNGEFSCDGTMPIVYEEDEVAFIIDTRDSASKDVLKDYKSNTQAFLITKNKIYNQTSGSIQTTNLDDLKQFSFTKNSVTDKLPSWQFALIIIVAICIPIFSFIGNLLVAYLVVGLGGLLISSILTKELKYIEIVKLGIYSMTLPLIINTIWTIIGISFPFSTLAFIIIYLGIAFTYLTLGLRALDENSYKENIFYQTPQYTPQNNNQNFNNQYNQNSNNQYSQNQNNQNQSKQYDQNPNPNNEENNNNNKL